MLPPANHGPGELIWLREPGYRSVVRTALSAGNAVRADHFSSSLVSSTAEQLAEVEPSSYVRAGYTPAIEKAHSEMLPELSRPRISVGLDLLAVMHLKRNGGSAYVPPHAVQDLVKSRTASPVTDAPMIGQPVFAAVHIRRRTNTEVRKALKILHGLLATGRYGDTGANISDQPRH